MRSCRRERKTGIRLGGPEALPQCVAGSSGAKSTGAAGSSTSIARVLRSGTSATRRLGRHSEVTGAEPSRTSQQPVAASTGPSERSSASGQQQVVSRWRSSRQKKTPPPTPAASKVRVSTKSGASSLFIRSSLYASCQAAASPARKPAGCLGGNGGFPHLPVRAGFAGGRGKARKRDGADILRRFGSKENLAAAAADIGIERVRAERRRRSATSRGRCATCPTITEWGARILCRLAQEHVPPLRKVAGAGRRCTVAGSSAPSLPGCASRAAAARGAWPSC